MSRRKAIKGSIVADLTAAILLRATQANLPIGAGKREWKYSKKQKALRNGVADVSLFGHAPEATRLTLKILP
ncbi:hypothetical protein [Hymenobacter volaticus]|uniref:Uncharacterized protein n=1 Tax=Hymenobacter volaticus TaxID=2932254 RepID=A0ABY4GCX3_9BACT|nr:hypothetical protein [Hymenobacter volaticus]UOQ68596.1 hypothetical protein MUN86_24130 [Hymenobacter volaticus]